VNKTDEKVDVDTWNKEREGGEGEAKTKLNAVDGHYLLFFQNQKCQTNFYCNRLVEAVKNCLLV